MISWHTNFTQKNEDGIRLKKLAFISGGFIYCVGYYKLMYVSVSVKKNVKYKLVYYHYQNKSCLYKENEVRDYVIFDQLYIL